VHVAQRHADHAGRDAAAGTLDGVGVGPRVAWDGLDLIGHTGRLRRGDQAREDDGVDGGAASNDWPLAQAYVAEPLFVAPRAGVIERVRHVNRDADLRVDRERAGVGAAQPDLLLHRGHAGQRGHGVARRHLLERLGHDERAHLVVQRARDNAAAAAAAAASIVVQALQADRERDGVADAHAIPYLVARPRAHVDPQVAQFDFLVALVALHQVDRPPSDPAQDRPRRGVDVDALAGRDDGVVPADRSEIDEAVVVDIGHHETNLVDMAGEQHARRAAGIDRGDGVAMEVGARLIGHARGLTPPDLARWPLEPRGAGRLDQ